MTRSLLSRLPGLPVPSPRQASVYVAVALSVGIILGSAIGPASPAAKQLLLGGSSAQASRPGTGSAAAPADSSAQLGAPPGDVATGSAAPAASAPAAAPPPGAAIASEPSVPLDGAVPLDDPVVPVADDPTEEIDLAGTVVHANPAAHSYALATSQAELIAVHADRLPDPAARLKVKVKRLANGTMSELKRSEQGSERAAKLRGTVTFVSDDARSYVVSVRGVSLLVSAPEAISGQRPKLRSLVSLEVRLEDPPQGSTDPVIVRETSLKLEGDASGPVELEGTVRDLDEQARTLTLTADDLRASGSDLKLIAPATIDLSRFKTGDAIIAAAEIDPQGAYTLTGTWSDGDAKAADDPAKAQGDQKP